MNNAIASLKWLALAGACLLSVESRAQAAPTAEGAQAFLAAMAKRGFARATFVDALGRANFVTGTRTVSTQRILGSSIKKDSTSNPVQKNLGELKVAALASGDAQGAADACTTRIESVQGSSDLYESTSKSWEEKKFLLPVIVLQYDTSDYSGSYTALAVPHYIDWRQAEISRSNDGSRIDVRVRGEGPAANILSFVPGDPELADRIEYAAKFLRMSCDEVAETGF